MKLFSIFLQFRKQFHSICVLEINSKKHLLISISSRGYSIFCWIIFVKIMCEKVRKGSTGITISLFLFVFYFIFGIFSDQFYYLYFCTFTIILLTPYDLYHLPNSYTTSSVFRSIWWDPFLQTKHQLIYFLQPLKPGQPPNL